MKWIHKLFECEETPQVAYKSSFKKEKEMTEDITCEELQKVEQKKFLEQLLSEQFPKINNDQLLQLTEYKIDHQKDLKSYYFHCKKWKDFMEFEITRNGVDLATILHLNNPGQIKINKIGSTANLEGCRPIVYDFKYYEPRGIYKLQSYFMLLEYQDSWRLNNKKDDVSFPKHGVNGVWKINVQPYKKIGYKYPIFYLDTDDAKNNINLGMNYYNSKSKSEGMFILDTLKTAAQPAVDDTIRFDGPNGTLYVPHGKIEEVKDKILTELGK